MSNRQFKFRVWDQEKNKFHTFSDFDVKIFLNGECEISSCYRGNVDLDTDDSLILQQSINLFDHNGKEIYEGDILEFFESRVSLFKGSQIFQIKYIEDLSRFILYKDSGTWWDIEKQYMNKGVIIGNIFQNLELLK